MVPPCPNLVQHPEVSSTEAAPSPLQLRPQVVGAGNQPSGTAVEGAASVQKSPAPPGTLAVEPTKYFDRHNASCFGHTAEHRPAPADTNAQGCFQTPLVKSSATASPERAYTRSHHRTAGCPCLPMPPASLARSPAYWDRSKLAWPHKSFVYNLAGN